MKPYAILRRGGLKIGVFGLLTDITRVVQREVADRVPRLGDIESAQKWADFLKEKKHCDVVIALTHIGFDTEGFSDPSLVRSTRNVDIVVGGHSHTFLKDVVYEKNLDGKEVPIVQDGCWGLNFGQLDVYKK